MTAEPGDGSRPSIGEPDPLLDRLVLLNAIRDLEIRVVDQQTAITEQAAILFAIQKLLR